MVAWLKAPLGSPRWRRRVLARVPWVFLLLVVLTVIVGMGHALLTLPADDPDGLSGLQALLCLCGMVLGLANATLLVPLVLGMPLPIPRVYRVAWVAVWIAGVIGVGFIFWAGWWAVTSL